MARSLRAGGSLRSQSRPKRSLGPAGTRDGGTKAIEHEPAQTESRAVRPALDLRTTVAIPGSRLRPSDPAALRVHRLRLLPPGPDRVHGSWSRRTRPSTLLTGGCPVVRRPQAGNRPGVSRVSDAGDPEPPA